MSDSATRETNELTAAAFAKRLFTSTLGAAEIMSVYLGDRLGWYRCLAEDGPATPQELAARAGGDERYAREWLEQQAVFGILGVDEIDLGAGDADGGRRRYRLAPGAREVLTDESSLNYLAPLARMFSAVKLPELVEAYRVGGGVNWETLGADAREGQAEMNRPWFETQLPGALAGVADIHAILSRPGVRIADVGCGGGWSSIALARAYPGASVEGFDIDAPSIELARRNAEAAGLADRARFRAADGSELAGGPYDAVFAFECLHDIAQPVEVLAAARRAVRDDGAVVIMDEAAEEAFSAPGGDTERLLYGFSVLMCLPDSMSHRPTAATGTVMRPHALRRYAQNAGFADIEILPIDDFGFWRFYRLTL